VEVWRDGELAGGLYGVAIGAAFCGESMFSRVPGASKVALASLVERLQGQGFMLLDTQWVTPHLEKFGACEIPRSEYLEQLAKAVEIKTSFWE
jgi:leucyl/phenylalanyl-tRNA--protein transferase